MNLCDFQDGDNQLVLRLVVEQVISGIVFFAAAIAIRWGIRKRRGSNTGPVEQSKGYSTLQGTQQNNHPSASDQVPLRQELDVLMAVHDIGEQGRTQRARAESEHLNRAIVHALPDLIIRMNRDGTYIDVRPAKTFPTIRGVAIGANVRDILPASIAQKRIEMAEQAINTGEPQSYEFPLWVNGKPQCQEAYIAALNHEEVIVVVRDMTAYKEAVEQLHQRDAEHQAILTAIPDLIMRLQSDGMCLGYVKTSAFHDFVPQDCDPVGKYVTDYVPDDHAQRHLFHIQRALETRQCQVYEQEVRVDGQVQYEEVRVVASGQDEVLLIIRDIGDRKRSEIECDKMKVKLQQQLNRVLLLEQITHEIRSSLDSQYIFQVTVNQVGRALGASRCLIHVYIDETQDSVACIPFVAEYVDVGYSHLLQQEIPWAGNQHAQYMMTTDYAIASNNVYDDPLLRSMHELCQQAELKSMLACRTSYLGRPNGAIVLHQCDRYRMWTDDDVALLEAVASQVGIALYQSYLLEQEVEQRNELALNNQALQKAKTDAELANRAKSTFLATMSHELRTPLNIILGFAQVLHSSPVLPEEHQEDAALILESGEHLLGLINNVLELSKIEAGVVLLNEDMVDIRQLVHSIQLMFSQKIQQKGLLFIVEQASDLPQYIVADEGKIRQILINLLNNAIKFTERGAITLSVTRRDDQEPEQSDQSISSESQSTQPQIGLRFDVKDTGYGIPPEELEKIFGAFVQTELGKGSSEGTGLGLAISQKFARLMGGEISLQSTVGEGTCFSVDIQVGAQLDQAIAPLTHQESIPASEASQALDDSQKILAHTFSSLTPQTFQQLSPDWVTSLYDASIRCDDSTARHLLHEISDHEVAIAKELSCLIDSFQFDQIVDLIEQSTQIHC